MPCVSLDYSSAITERLPIRALQIVKQIGEHGAPIMGQWENFTALARSIRKSLHYHHTSSHGGAVKGTTASSTRMFKRSYDKVQLYATLVEEDPSDLSMTCASYSEIRLWTHGILAGCRPLSLV